MARKIDPEVDEKLKSELETFSTELLELSDLSSRRVSHERLKEWSDIDDADRLVVSISKLSKSLKEFLSGDQLQEDSVLLLVKILAHATAARKEKADRHKIFDVVCKSRFLVNHLRMFILCVLEMMGPRDVHGFVFATVSLLKTICDELPEHAMKCVLTSAQMLSVAKHMETVVQNKELTESMMAVDKLGKEIYMKNKVSECKSQLTRLTAVNDDEDPPECYRSLPIIPSVSELTSQTKVFLRKAVTDGRYNDANHYLDVQFRLLRQDFFYYLQQGITLMRESKDLSAFHNQAMRLFHNVRVVGMSLDHKCNYVLQLKQNDTKTRKVKNKSCLSPGSIVFLSKDHFQTIIVAIVSSIDVLKDENIIIAIDIKEGLEVVFNATATDVFIIAVATTNFKPYLNVLKLLHENETGELPMEDTILYCHRKSKPPKYLLPSSGFTGIPYYNLSALMLTKESVLVPVLTTVKWPQTEEMCLNELQREAVMLALTKEVSILQGPPGTGKSHVGSKILEVLLRNEPLSSHVKTDKGINKPCSKGPILIVCKTLKALKKLLMERSSHKSLSGLMYHFGIEKSTVVLDEYDSLESLGRTTLSVKNTSLIYSVKEKIDQLNKIMGSLETEIQSTDVLKPYMFDHHYASLTRATDLTNGNHALKVWLNTPLHSPMTTFKKPIEQRLKDLVLRWNRPSNGVYFRPSMNIVERASQYWCLVNLYRQNIKKEIKKMSNYDESLPVEGEDLKLKLQQSYVDFISDNLMQKITGKSHTIDMSAWLAESRRDPMKQLNDIETLIREMELEAVKTGSCPASVAALQGNVGDVVQSGQNDPFADVDFFRFLSGVKNAFEKYEIITVTKHAEKLKIVEDNPGKVSYWSARRASPSQCLSHAETIKLLALTEPLEVEEEENIVDLWGLKEKKRFALYKCWVEKYKTSLTEDMKDLAKQYNSLREQDRRDKGEVLLREIKSAKVIGTTLATAAENIELLKEVGCRVVIVAEAAKILESNVVTLLSEACEHLIMIGDHQQLHAETVVPQIAKDFGLEMSLFERLIKNNIPHVQLRVQYNMRPEIAKLMRLIYPDLKDDVSVCNLDHVRGICKDVFFIDHRVKSTKSGSEESQYNNTHEAKYLAALCKYLLNQDYKPSDVTILAPHDFQVHAIKTQLTGCLKLDQQVKVSSVDEFQGQDSDIVLLSLTAGNEDEAQDVILEDGWISVALSRAKVGLYVIGNFDVLACQSPLWSKIVATAQEDEIIAWGLPVYCQNHPSTKKRLVNVTDFGRCPEGGCGRPCAHQLRCGHTCVLSCHGYDITHVKYKCLERCSKSCKAGHPCEKHCFLPCMDCLVPVLKVFPECGDLNEIPCYTYPEVCKQECSYKLPCQHKCSGICCKTRSGNVHKECTVPVTYLFSPCGHYGHVPCHKWNTQVPCDKPCEAVLSCGHQCKGSCSSCLRGAVHQVCQEQCPKFLPCGHRCTGYCGTPCLPCTEICPFQCSHKSCQSGTHPHKCGQPCPPCTEQCVTKCKHVSGTKLCSQQWKTCLCNKTCNRKFENIKRDQEASGGKICNHNCAGICGELCVCLHCDRVNDLRKVGNNPKQTLDEGLVSKILDNLDEKLIFKIPSCGHIFYVEQFDAFIANNAPEGTSFILCPVCPKPIMQCKRYDNVLNARHKRREDQKALLLSQTNVSDCENRKLKQSHEILKMMSSTFYERLVVHKSHSYNTIELQALSFKMKILFVLRQILTLGTSLQDEVEMDLLIMKYSILRSPNRVTSQRKQESLFEVLRCLKLKVLIFLENLICQHDIQAPRSLTWQVESVISVLRGSQRNPENLSKADSVIMSISQIIGESSAVAQAVCCPIIKKYKELIGVLLSSDSKMLCDLVHPDDAQPIPDSTPVPDQQSDLKQELTADLQSVGPRYSPSTDNSPRQTADEGQSFYGRDTKETSKVDLDHHEVSQEGFQYQDMFDVDMFKAGPELDLRPAETVADKKEPLHEEEQFPILIRRPVEANGQSPTKPGVRVSEPNFFNPKRDHRLHTLVGQQNSQIIQMSSNSSVQSGPSFSEMCSRPATVRPVKQTRGKMLCTFGDTGIDKEQTSKVNLNNDELGQDECRGQDLSTVGSTGHHRPNQALAGENETHCEEEQFPSLIRRSSERNENLLTKPVVKLSDPKFSKATTTWGNHLHPFVGHQNSQTKKVSSDVDSAYSVQSKPSLSEMWSSPVVHKQRTSRRVKPKHGKIPVTFGSTNRVAMMDSKKETNSTTFSVSSEADFPTLGGSKK